MAGFSLGLDARRARGAQFDFSAGALPPGATLTRASPASCVGPDGRAAMLPADTARFDHDPVLRRRRGLLVEPAATNLVVSSRTLGEPAWLVFRGLARIGPLADAAPDGGAATRIAFGIVGGTDVAGAAALYQPVSWGEAGGAWTASCWVRAVAGTTSVRLGLYPGALPVASSGDVTVTDGAWTRLAVTAIAAAGGGDMSLRNDVAGASADVLVWGAQFEAGSAATSAIATDGAPATRAADVLTLDWGRQGVPDGPATLRLFLATGTGSGDATEDVGAIIAGGVATVPPRARPLVAVRLA